MITPICKRKRTAMKHIHILITDDNNPEHTLVRLPDEMLPIVGMAQVSDTDAYGQIRNLLLSIGFPAHLKGYHYLITGIQLTLSRPELLGRLTGELYPAIAERYDTTASKVERAIRHAIDIAWQRGRVEQVNQLVGCHAACQEDKPTSGQLIATIAELIWRQNKN